MKPIRQKQLAELLKSHYFNLDGLSEESLIIYDQALTHSSYAKEQRDKGSECQDYERLEFLGNFVLGLVVSEYLYKNYDISEGEMTKRMTIVSDVKLAEVIKKKKIAIDRKSILLGKRELGRSKVLEDSIIACAFEALIGALYLDKGLTKTRKILIEILGDEINELDLGSNYIGRLQELVQKKKCGELVYSEKRLTGPDHKPTYKAVVKLSGKRVGEGVGRNKKAAKMNAAKAAMNKLKSRKKESKK
jgi:ribonuclease-3